MMRFFFAIIAAAAVAGCGKEPVAPEASKPLPVVMAAGTVSSDANACGKGDGFDALPAGVCLPATYRFRGERAYVDGAGRDRRRITFDFVDGDAELVSWQVSGAFASTGYYVRPKMDTTDGSLQIPMTKTNMGTTYLSVRSLPETAPANPNRKGSFFIDFLIAPNAAAGQPVSN